MKNIHEEFYSGNITAVEEILRSDPTSANATDDQGKTILHLAASNGNAKLVNIVIAIMQSNLQPEDNVGQTPLDLAHANEQYPIISQLGLEILRREFVIYKSIPEPTSQAWLINRLILRGFKISEKGMCYGIAQMAKQAFFAGEINVFINRLKNLNISETALSFNERLNSLEREKDQIIKRLARPSYFSYFDNTEELNERLAEIRTYLTDIDAFFTGISLYQNPEKYLQDINCATDSDFLFSRSDNIHQKTNPASFWLKPIRLDGNEIVDIKQYDIAFASTVSIKKFLNLLELFLSSCTFSISLEHDHGIEISYSPQSKWLLTNGNHLPTLSFSCVEKLAVTIHYAMEIQVKAQNSHHVFCRLIISSLASSRDEIATKLNLLEESAHWQYFQNYFINFTDRAKLEELTNSGANFKELISINSQRLKICSQYKYAFNWLIKNGKLLYSDINNSELSDLEYILTNEDLYSNIKSKPLLQGKDIASIVKFLKNLQMCVCSALIPDNILSYILNDENSANFFKRNTSIFKFLALDCELQNKILENLSCLLEILSPEDISNKLLIIKAEYIVFILDNIDKMKELESQQIAEILATPTPENIVEIFQSNIEQYRMRP